MTLRDDEPPTDVPNGVPVAAGMERTYSRIYANGRVDLAADGPPEYSSVVKDTLRWAAHIDVAITRDRFFDTLVKRNVPIVVAQRIAASVLFLDDETYFSGRPSG